MQSLQILKGRRDNSNSRGLDDDNGDDDDHVKVLISNSKELGQGTIEPRFQFLGNCDAII